MLVFIQKLMELILSVVEKFFNSNKEGAINQYINTAKDIQKRQKKRIIVPSSDTISP